MSSAIRAEGSAWISGFRAALKAVDEPVWIATNDVRLSEAHYVQGEPLKNGAKVAWGKLTVIGPKPHVEMDANFPVEVAFGDTRVPAEGLDEILKGVRGTIDQAFRLLDLPAL